MSDKHTRCYARRRLSPFQGYTQVIEAGRGQASSNNGLDWRVQVRLPKSGDQHDTQPILFGFWSSEGGFHRVPLPPLIASEQIEIAAQPIMDELLHTTRQVPFTPIDQVELWLLDEADMSPLALIASCSDPAELPPIPHPEWKSTVHADHSFTRSWSKSEYDDAPRNELNTLIRQAAGANPAAQWFLRKPDGKGMGIDGINITTEIKSRQLDKDEFPELLLKQDWQDETTQQLINDYINWQAPFLLTLPQLSSITRKRLEQQAFQQPFKVEGQHKLWPEIIDQEKLYACLVEAQMRRSQPDAGHSR